MSNVPNLVYPPIQKKAARRSSLYQRTSFILIFVNLSVLVLAAAVNDAGLLLFGFAYSKTLLLVISLILAGMQAMMGLDKKWYASRSLSETIKTLIWRYATNATPFHVGGADNELLLMERISDACHESNMVIGSMVFTSSNIDDTLLRMIQDCSFDEQVSIYMQKRVSDQLSWYENKSKYNSLRAKLFFILFISCNSLAVIFSALQESGNGYPQAITSLLVGLATAVIGWIQAKHYSELSAAYSLTHSEIRSLAKQVHNISTVSQFADFVMEAESLFSREHTQWAAKRGSVVNHFS